MYSAYGDAHDGPIVGQAIDAAYGWFSNIIYIFWSKEFGFIKSVC